MSLQLIIVIILSLAPVSSAIQSVESAESRIHQKLFGQREFTLDTRPVSGHDEPTKVHIFVFVDKFIEAREKDGVLSTQISFALEWNDARLSWNSQEIENTPNILVKSEQIWTPDIVLLNNAKSADAYVIAPQSNYVTISSSGRCRWSPLFQRTESHCSMDTTWFPFDVQRCNLTYGSWNYGADKLKLVPYSYDKERFVGYAATSVPGDVWQLTHADVLEDVDDVTGAAKVAFSYRLRRQPCYYFVHIVVPCILLSLVAVAVFFLQPHCTERLGLNITIVLALGVYQLIVCHNFSAASSNIPVIVVYFVFVMILCVLSLVTTIFVMYLNMCADSVPVPTIPAWTKWLVCKKLASCLCFRTSLKTAAPSPIASRKNSADAGDFHKLHNMETSNSEQLQMLMEIRDLLKSKYQRESEERDEDDDNEVKKYDWKLAADVIDRILLMFFSVVFIGGTIVFFCIFYAAHSH